MSKKIYMGMSIVFTLISIAYYFFGDYCAMRDYIILSILEIILYELKEK